VPTNASAAARSARSLGAIGVCLMLVVAGCSGDDDDPTPSTTISPTTTTIAPRTSDGVLKVGAFLPLTGPGAAFGPPMIEALVDARDDINAAGGVLGHDVELIQLDEGAGTIEELLAEGVDAIVGPASSTLALSTLGPAVDEFNGVVTCSPMATALALDDYPDNDFFFRTAPSDSLQMLTIARQAQGTGAQSVAVGYLDDPYGRGLVGSFEDALDERLPVTAVGFGADQDELDGVAAELLADDPGVVVVLGDADDGSRLLAALDEANPAPPQVLINDSMRQARAVIQNLSPTFRERLTGHAPRSGPATEDGYPGFFVSHAVDCLNLITLAVIESDSDNPLQFRRAMSQVSSGGRPCTGFDVCAGYLREGLEIDYNGYSGPVNLSPVTGDVTRAFFDSFHFRPDGNEILLTPPIDTSTT
jgi:branched-chain amino acid transport system substrate-binding protein